MEKFGRKTKVLMFNELKEKFNASQNFILTNYKGLKAQEMDNLRRRMKQCGSGYFIVKNSILKRVLGELNLKELGQDIQGEIGVGFAKDYITASKVLIQYAKENPSFKIRSGFIEGKMQPVDMIKHIASLPSREVLLTQVAIYIKSPISSFVNAVNGLMRGLVVVIDEIKKKMEKEGGK